MAGALTLAGCGASHVRTVLVTEPAKAPSTAVTTQTTYSQVGPEGTMTSTSTPATTTGTTTTGTTTSGTTTTGATTSTFTTAALTHLSHKPLLHLTAFLSPTGNIGCQMLDGFARCDILQRSWSPPPHPASCSREVDYGQGLEVGATGKAGFVCAGDTARDPNSPPLRYGYASVEGKIACVSAFTGMTCTSADGHGFFISRQRYRIF